MLYAIPAFFCLIVNVSIYGQNTKAKTHSSEAVKSNSVQFKPKVVKATNSFKSYRINRQWKTKSLLGMFSSFPTKVKKISSQKFDHYTETKADESSVSENDKEVGFEKKGTQSFWKALKLFKEE